MKTRSKGKAIIGISMAAIMVVSVLAVAMPMVSAESEGDNFNHIGKDTAAVQTVLVGQNIKFVKAGTNNFDIKPTVYRYVSGDLEDTYTANKDWEIYNVNWPTSGAYYVSDNTSNPKQAQISIKDPKLPLELKVGDKKVASIAVGTSLTVDTGGINLFDMDKVDLVIIGPDGQIKEKKIPDTTLVQDFTGITVADLTKDYFTGTLNTNGWSIGDYTFKVETKSESACGLEAESSVKLLRIIKGVIEIGAETTSTIELSTLGLTVMGVAKDPIRVEAFPTSENVIFQAGIDDTPMDATDSFTDDIDADGIRKYAVVFNDTGSYTIKVTVTGGDRTGESDTVDITVLEKNVEFDLPSIVVIGDKLTVKGTANTGTYVSVYVDDTLYKKLDNLVIEDGEFNKEVKTTDMGMNVPGSVRLKAWIDCRDICSGCRVVPPATSTQNIPEDVSSDGEDAVLLTTPELTAELPVKSVALEDDFWVTGTAKGELEVTILCVPPKGGGGNSLTSGGKGISKETASVSTTDYTFSKKMNANKDATAGYYDIYVLSIGMDNEWDMSGEVKLVDALNESYNIPSLTTGVICTKTQTEVDAILVDMVTTAGSDDLMWKGRLKVETPYVRLDPVPSSTDAGEPLIVKGTSNRQEGYVIVVTCKGPVELEPRTVKVANDMFTATFDTTEAKTGEYIVKADDGDGHTDEVELFITGKEMLKAEAAIEKAVEEVEKVVEEILATPKPTPAPTPAPTPEPTPKPPGFEAIFAIAGLLAVAYLVHRRKN